MLDLLLMRHGEAIDDAPPALGDDGRWLTGRGREQTRAVAAVLARIDNGAPPLALWTSPLVRAVQTAEVAASALGLTDAVRVQESLSTRGSPRELRRMLAQYAGPAPLLLVGHEPGLSMLAVELLGSAGNAHWPGFRKSGVLALRVGAAQPFQWVLDPQTLARIEDPALLGGERSPRATVPAVTLLACDACGARWSDDEWTEGCRCCGGGALTRPCVQCGELCGERSRKAVDDSNDLRVAHWISRCGLALERRGPLVEGLVRAYRLLVDDPVGRPLAVAARASMPERTGARHRGDAPIRELTAEARAFTAWLQTHRIEAPPAWLPQLWDAVT